MSSSGPSDKERLIIEAAMIEFGALGVHGARMQAIADRAGVNKALLHYYFRSKEQLYLEVLRRIITPFLDRVGQGVSALAPGDFAGFVRVIAAYLIEGGQQLPLSRILFTELSCGGQYLSRLPEMQGSLPFYDSTVGAFLNDCIRQGIVKPHHPMKIFMSIVGMCWNAFLGAPIADSVYDYDKIARDKAFYDDYLETIVDIATSGLLL